MNLNPRPVVAKPKSRSPLRMTAGVAAFRLRRKLLQWSGIALGRVRYGRQRPAGASAADAASAAKAGEAAKVASAAKAGGAAKAADAVPLPQLAAAHATPLFRQLSGVEDELQVNKVANLRLAVARVDGLQLEPGETMSYWRLIGKPTRAKGYREGMLLSNGRVTRGVGGGLCQLSNLIYWLTLHTPLTVTERHRHSYDVFPDAGRTQPFGSGATCYYNYIDLQIRNDTPWTYRLGLRLTDTHLHGEWRTDCVSDTRYEIYEARHWFSQELWGGYVRHNEIRRRLIGPEGEHLGDELMAENHALMMYDPSLPAAGNGQSGGGA